MRELDPTRDDEAVTNGAPDLAATRGKCGDSSPSASLRVRMTSGEQRQQQIPCGNDKQEGEYNSRFPAGMTNKKASTTADSLRERQTRRRVQQRIPCGNDKQRNDSRFWVMAWLTDGIWREFAEIGGMQALRSKV